MSKTISWTHVINTVGAQLGTWIQELSKHLGVAATYLWTVEMKQMYVTGLQRAIGSAICLIIIFISWGIKRIIWKATKDDKEYAGMDWLMIIPMIVAGIVFIPLLMSAIGHVINPGYYAIYDIIHQINTLRGGGN